MGEVCILKASAGTGKTYQLTKEIVSWYLKDLDSSLDHFLLITFTRNAAAELLQRFLEEDLLPILTLSQIPEKEEQLSSLSHRHVWKKYGEFLFPYLNEWESWRGQIRYRFFHDLLKQDNMLVGTIDSILSGLTRQLFLLAGISPRWESVLQFSFEELRFFLLEEEQSPPPSLQAWLEQERNPYKKVKEIIQTLLTDEKGRLCLLEWDLALWQRFEKHNEKGDFSDYVEREWIKTFSGQFLGDWMDEARNGHSPFSTLFSSSPNRLSEEDRKKEIKKFKRATIDFLFFYYFYNRIRKYEQRENRISLASQREYLVYFVTLLTPEPLYQYLGTRIAFVGWDEFQDTSYIQYYLFFPLLQEVSSRGEADGKGKLLFVGDLKQSIYIWRNSEPEIMANFLRNDFQNPITKSLQDNYRSSEELLAFFSYFMNQFLKQIEDNDVLSLIDIEETKAQFHYTETLRFRGKEVNWDPETQGFPNVIISVLKEKQNYHDLIASIQKERTEGTPYHEMLILVRKNEEVNQIEEALKREQIPVIPMGKRKMGSFLEVQWLYYLACYLLADTEEEKTLAKAHLQAILLDKLHNEKGTTIDQASYFLKVLLDALPDKRRKFLGHLPVMDFFERLVEWTQAVDENGLFCFENEGVQSFFSLLFSRKHYRTTHVKQFLSQFPLLAREEVEVEEGTNAVRVMTIHQAKGLESKVVFIVNPLSLFSGRETSYSLDVRLPFYLVYWLFTGKDCRSDPNTCFSWYYPFSYKGIQNFLKKHEPSLQQSSLFQELHRAIKKAVHLDIVERLNLLYVAITRAKERIYFLLPKEPSKKKQSASQRTLLTLLGYALEHTFADICQKATLVQQGFQREEVSSSSERGFQENEEKVMEWRTYSWRTKIGFVPPKPLYSHYNPEALQMGMMVHRYLSQKNPDAQISNPLIQKAIQNARRLFQEQGLDTYFSETMEKKVKLLSEMTLVAEQNNEIQILRPDFVIIDEEFQKGWIIDFKYSDLTEIELKEHEEQVRNYYRILSTNYFPSVQQWNGYLFYLQGEGYSHEVRLK